MLFSIEEYPGVFVDAAIHHAGQWQFLSILGRDGSVQHFLAALSLAPTEGGIARISLLAGKSRISGVVSKDLEKLTARFPRPNLFGSLVHCWIYESALKKSSTAEGHWILKPDERLPITQKEVWAAVTTISRMPLLPAWGNVVMNALGGIQAFCSGNLGSGQVSAYLVKLPDNFEQNVSELIKARHIGLNPNARLAAT